MPSKRVLLQNVGVGKTLDSALKKCISDRHPNLVVFLHTEDGMQNLEKMCAYCEKEGLPCKKVLLGYPKDPLKVFRDVESCVQRLVAEGYAINEIEVDFTGGYKGMSAGASFAAAGLGLNLFYTDGDRDERGTVIPNTERVIPSNMREFKAWSAYKEAVCLFNKRNFDGAIELSRQAQELWGNPELSESANRLMSLSRACHAWDLFDYKNALLLLDRETINYYSGAADNLEQTKRHLDNIVRSYEKALCDNKERYNGGHLRVPPMSLNLVVDLLENARRRYWEGKYDDAIARVYRFLELVAQRGLFQRRLVSAAVCSAELESVLSDKYDELPDKFREKLSKNKTCEVALDNAFRILELLNDPAGLSYKEHRKVIKDIQGHRNYSMLMHGFEPVSKGNLEKVLTVLGSLAQELVTDYAEITKMAQFPIIHS